MVVIVNDDCSRTLVASGEAFAEATTGSVMLRDDLTWQRISPIR